MKNSHLLIQQSLEAIERIILGKSSVVKLTFAALLARGTILIEDRPGLGKTTLAKTLSKVLGLSFQRIQCTNDLLPMDILGRFDYSKEPARFIEGPIFASIVILDELNRAPSRTQSAFLQAMEEGEISLEGQIFPMPQPQIFIATQNPADQVGTSFLPESELDRFTIQIEMGYPDPESEKKILRGQSQKEFKDCKVILSKPQVIELQTATQAVFVSDQLIELVIRFLQHGRSQNIYFSPRVGRDLIKMAQALALIEGQNYVNPDHIKFVMKSVIGHRTKKADEIIQNFQFQA